MNDVPRCTRGATGTSSAPRPRSSGRCTTSSTTASPAWSRWPTTSTTPRTRTASWATRCCNLPLQDNTHTAARRGRRAARRTGARASASALYDAALALVRDAGRTHAHGLHRPAGRAARGPGHARRDDRRRPGARPTTDGPRFLRAARLRARAGRAVLGARPARSTPDLVAKHRADGRGARRPRLPAGDRGRATCPDEWVDQYALLNTRMSTDAPLGGLDLEEDVWDAERIRATEKQYDERGLELLVLAAEHVPTRTLAAFTCFMAVARTPTSSCTRTTPSCSRSTAGERLGMLVKTANLQRLAAERPTVRRVGTWNAEENSLHARHQRGARVPAGRRLRGVAAQAELTRGGRACGSDCCHQPDQRRSHLGERGVVEPVGRQDRVDRAVRRRGRRRASPSTTSIDSVIPCSWRPNCSGRPVRQRAAEQGAVGPAGLHVTADGHAADRRAGRRGRAAGRGGRRRRGRRRSASGGPGRGGRVEREPQLVRERDPALVDLVAHAVERVRGPRGCAG